MSKETLKFRGVLTGHSGWVTAIATPVDTASNTVISASRDKTVMVWEIDPKAEQAMDDYEPRVGTAKRSLRGHNHYVQDVVLSLDAQYCLSGSWDGTLRLWDLKNGSCTRTFVGHGKDVLSVAFSVDNRQIVSGSRDKTIRLWNTLGDCKYTWGLHEDGHKDWVSCVRFSPNPTNPVIVSCGWDKQIKVWNLTPKTNLLHNLVGHSGYINAVTVSPDGSLCASGGKDGTTMLWDLNEGKRLYQLEAGDIIHALCFSPMRYWLVAATQKLVKVWDLESKTIVEELKVPLDDGAQGKTAQEHYCVSLAWSADGQTLYAGCTNGNIYSFVVDII